MNNTLFIMKIKDILSIPSELNDVFEMCSNEINLCKDDMVIVQFYIRIFFDCLMYYKGLTNGGEEIVSYMRNDFVKSKNRQSALLQYKQISKPTHVVPSYLLLMLNKIKKINFLDKNLQDHNPLDIITNLLLCNFTGKTHYSKSYIKKLLNLKIEVN